MENDNNDFCARNVVAYVSGPYRATEQQKIKGDSDEQSEADNILAASRVASGLWEMGLSVICPHLNSSVPLCSVVYYDETWKFKTKRITFAPVSTRLKPDDYLTGDITILKRCDILVLTSQWRESVGATKEMELARKLKMPIFEADKTSVVRLEATQCGECDHKDISMCMRCSIFTNDVVCNHAQGLSYYLDQSDQHDTTISAPDSATITSTTNELRDLLLRKNANYGGSFKQPDAFGGSPENSMRARISDKIERLKTLISGGNESVGESINDTLLDLAGYFLLWKILRETEGTK